MFSKRSDSWNDGLESGGRRPRLFVITMAKIEEFSGENISGMLAVLSSSFEKNGKWSNTTYRFATAKGVSLVESLTPLHGKALQMYGSWDECAEALSLVSGVPCDPAVVRNTMMTAYPRSSGPQTLDEREVALASLK